MPLLVVAQDRLGKWYVSPRVSLLYGGQQVNSQWQLAGGIRLRDWKLGVGAGIDYHRVRAVPLFTDVQYTVTKTKNNALFTYANLGYSMPWTLDRHHRNYPTWGDIAKHYSRFVGGLYTEIGIGNEIKWKGKRAFALSVGYSLKQLVEYYKIVDPASSQAFPMGLEEERAIIDNHRLAFKLGIVL